MSQDHKKKIKILCIDDEADLLQQLAELVINAGFVALTASSVVEAEAIIKKESSRLSLVISDYAMGDKNGFDLRRFMMTEYKHIPFILISGNITREDALQAVELKISAFIEKPFVLDDFVKSILNESKDRVVSIRDDDELLAGFLVDASALTEEMEGLILSLEDNPSDVEVINRIFACAHTIKGASGFFRPDTVHRFTHRYEDFLSIFKKEPEKLNSGSISILLKGLDIIKNLLQALANDDVGETSLESLVEIFSETTHPIENSIAEAQKTSTKTPEAHAVSQPKQTEELRVSIALLNDFMEKSGEITVLRNMINKVQHAIELGNPFDPNVSMLSDLLTEMHKVISSMQDQLGDLRKVPVKQVFKPLSRTLRDLSISLKKQIALETSGEDLRIDHTLAETLNKCLVHMVRNSADHGIESSEQRIQAGKPPNGTIKISCSELPEEIVVKMADDGRGIDPQRVRLKAIEKGLITTEMASKMSDAETRMLIFEPGFSTAEQVTDVSGRGVGTDMVKKTITSLGGYIQLDSQVGKGTTFSLHLPIPKSVLIINSLMVRISGQIFSIPQDKIIRVIKIFNASKDKYIKNIGDLLFYHHENEIVPIVHVNQILGLDNKHTENNLDTLSMVMVQSKNGNYCMHVDDILDVEEIVVKKFDRWFSHIQSYIGATFLGDGRVGLILDTDGIGEKAHLRAHHAVVKERMNEKVDSSKKNFNHEQSYLLFSLGNQSKYAVKQSDIFRLEELKPNQIRYIDRQPVTIYRNQTMPILEMKNFINQNNTLLKNNKVLSQDSIPTIIISHKGRYFAFAVESIGDFLAKDSSQDEIFSFAANTKTCIIQDQTVTILDLGQILLQVSEVDVRKAA